MRSLLWAVVPLAAGCGAAQHFDAAERATATSPQGDIAAEYSLQPPAAPNAEVKVWVAGAYKTDFDQREVTAIEVVFEMDNRDDEPIELTRLHLSSVRARGQSLGQLEPVRMEGAVLVAPGRETRIRALFTLPDVYDPEDIARMEVGWELSYAGETYAQRTPFQQPPYYYYYPDPWLWYPPYAHAWPLAGTMIP